MTVVPRCGMLFRRRSPPCCDFTTCLAMANPKPLCPGRVVYPRWHTCASAEAVQLPERADAALFNYTHDILRTPQAVANIVRFLVLDREFPRAIRYCLIWINHSLHELTGTQNYSFSNIAEKKVGAFLAELDYKDYEEIRAQGLHEFLDHVQLRCNDIGQAMAETFFLPVA